MKHKAHPSIWTSILQVPSNYKSLVDSELESTDVDPCSNLRVLKWERNRQAEIKQKQSKIIYKIHKITQS